ncbi:MAG: metallophosphoesterase [Clostridia bacterium]|nr:metallophosphoesterase [Clostridia bacterium]
MAKLPSSSPVFYPLYLAKQLYTVEEVYPSSQLPKEFNGLRIVFASDIHYGKLFGEERVRLLSKRINDLKADIVILGGDYGEHSDGAIRFFQLKPGFQANQMVLGVMGNHDRMYPEENFPLLLDAMRSDGVTPLVNDAVTIEREGKRLVIAATDDFFSGNPDLSYTAYRCRNADFVIYVSHIPDILPETYRMPGGPFYQLALCGHTHGGQVAIAGKAIKSSSGYGNRFLSGWYHENGVDIMVSNGVGTSSLPVRFGAKPQIHLITLRSTQSP